MKRTILTLWVMLFAGFFAGCTTTAPLEQRTASSWSLPVSQGPAGIRVMSFNLRRPVIFDMGNNWGFRKDAAVRAIELVDPDVLGTQECVGSVARDLDERLPGYARVSAGRNDGRNSGEMTAVYFKTARFTLLDSGHFWFSTSPDRPGKRSWGAWWPRMATWVHLRDDYTGRDFFAFNAHFSSASRNAREHSAVLLREQVFAIAGDAPAVVLGDFNTAEGTAPYETLTADGTLVDTFRVVHAVPGRDENTRHRFGGGTRGERIDWVLATSRLRVNASGILNQKINGRWVSDHFPVAAELSWPASAPLLVAEVPTDGPRFESP